MRLSSGHLLLLLIFNSVFSQNCNNNSNSKTDCGYTGITQDQCESKGCCWFPVQNANGIPWCFYGSDYIKGYQASNVQTSNSGLEADLTLVQGSNMYGEDIASLHLSVYYETESRLRVKIYDPNTERWEVPYVVQPTSKAIKGPSTTDYTFSYTSFPFGFAVTRTSTDEVLFNTTIQPTPSYNGLIFEDQYLEISSILPNNHNIYGLGEHIRPLKLDPQTYTLFNADHGTPANMNLYGSHPFYLDTRPSGNVHGVFLLNSNGMDIVLQENSLTYKVIGGILDFYFFTGPTPDSVIVQYTDLIGKPYMIPYWVLGFHQCRWGYKNIQEVETVVQNYKINDIPLEAMWTDIDYMDQYLDFTFDPVNFPPAQMKQFVDNLHKNNQHYVIITDPGIHNQTGYAPFDLGNQMDVWIKDVDGQPLIGKVWPGTTTFPDWTRSNAADYWYQNIKNFHDVAAFDGLWIDMNEISNFCNGNCESKTIPNSVSGFDPNNPPYAINNRNEHAALDQFTIRMDAVHNISIEYNVHNLFGMLEAIATQKALEKVRGQRALVISRSTFPSSGHYGGHWTGDVTSAWSDLYYTIPDMINFNFYGIPLIGADICGFNGNTTEELCARWIELGAFYPFCRDHNAIDQISQELYVWPLVANISRNILNVRYSLLPYYYTLFYQTHTGLVGTVIRPLFFEFPQDSATYAIDKQFLVGEGLMVSPVVTEGATTVDVYFPEGQWYDFFTQEPVTYSGETVTLQSPIDTVQVHVRGGIVIPMQTPSYTLTESRLNPYSLLVALDESGKASGELYLDDGESLDAISGGHFTYISYQVSSSNANGKMTASVGSIGFNPANSLQTVTIMGVQLSPSNVYMNGQAVNFSYTKTSKVLVISLKANMLQNFSITWF